MYVHTCTCRYKITLTIKIFDVGNILTQSSLKRNSWKSIAIIRYAGYIGNKVYFLILQWILGRVGYIRCSLYTANYSILNVYTSSSEHFSYYSYMVILLIQYSSCGNMTLNYNVQSSEQFHRSSGWSSRSKQSRWKCFS